MAASDISTHFNISSRQLKKLNPALRQSVFQGKKYIPRGYTLHLPQSKQYRQLITSIPPHMHHHKQKPTQFYRVKRGDTAGAIAGKLGISLHSLRRANNLNRNAAIFVGQNLRLPGIKQSSHTVPVNISQTKKKISKQTRQQVSRATASTSIPLLSGSKKTKPTWKKIQTAKSVVLSELSVRDIRQNKTLNRGTITILPEESLEILADWLQVRAATIRTLNSFKKKHILHPDESIYIPLNSVTVKTFEEKRFDFHLETEEDFFNAYKIVGVHSYTVQNGDTVWEICRKKFELPFWLLKKYNTKLNFNGLRSSQQLTIPIIKAI